MEGAPHDMTDLLPMRATRHAPCLRAHCDLHTTASPLAHTRLIDLRRQKGQLDVEAAETRRQLKRMRKSAAARAAAVDRAWQLSGTLLNVTLATYGISGSS